MQAQTDKDIPEVGQLVQARQRQFIVSSVQAGQTKENTPPQHLVTLSAIDDDRHGEEIQVLWEIEPGTRLIHKSELPDPRNGFDSPKEYQAFLNAIRWGAIASAERSIFHAPFRSGIDIEDFQLEPLMRALKMPRVNLLIADDVGLGKTIEAGLVMQELMLRNKVRTAFILCPASLQLQWKDQMQSKFGLEFRIVDRALMKEIRRKRGLHVNPWTHYPRLIASLDFIKQDKIFRQLREVLPKEEHSYPRKFDLLIVDEAHNISPSARGKYALDSQRTETVRALSPHFEHRLFLTATPHNGYSESFSALLELLDNQRFHRGVLPDDKQRDAVMIRRLKSELIELHKHQKEQGEHRRTFAERKIQSLLVDFSEEERTLHRELQEYANLRKESAKDNPREMIAFEFVLKLLKKRLFSCPMAFLLTLEKHISSLQQPKQKKKKKTSTKHQLKILQKKVEELEHEDFEDEGYFDDGYDYYYEEATDEVIHSAGEMLTEAEIQAKSKLSSMVQTADKLSKQGDAKAKALLEWLGENVCVNGKWQDTRVIIFTEYRSTQKWLWDMLEKGGFATKGRVEELHGGLTKEEREDIKNAFQTSPEKSTVRILLATDAASEGVNLQNYCSNLIHYEIPWNPNRMEQRNGRVDRHGQKQPFVSIYHFASKDFHKASAKRTGGMKAGELDDDLEFLFRVAEKVETIRNDLGKVGSVLADRIEKMIVEGKDTTLENLEEDRERIAKEKKAQKKEVSRFVRRLSEIQKRLDSSEKELHASPQNVLEVVEVGLKVAEQPPLQKDDGPCGLDAFQIPKMQGSWAKCWDGLPHPYTGDIRPIVFDNEDARDNEDVVLAHLNHPIVKLCSHYLRSEVWAPKEKQKLKRVCVKQTTTSLPSVICHARLVLLDAENTSIHEEIIFAGGYVQDGRFKRIETLKEVQGLLEESTELNEQPEPSHIPILSGWEELSEPLLKALERRTDERVKSLENAIQKKSQKEQGHVEQIISDLKKKIEAELADHQIEQTTFDFMSVEEQNQFERNRLSLEERLKSLPEECQKEVDAIQKRYSKTSHQMFPTSVMILLPESPIQGDV